MGDVRTVCVSREQASEGSQHGRCQNSGCVAGAGKRRESAWEMSEQWVCRGSEQTDPEQRLGSASGAAGSRWGVWEEMVKKINDTSRVG